LTEQDTELKDVRVGMRTDDYDYELPEELIAQHPEEKRDHSRLMVLDRSKHTIEDRHFSDIGDYLVPGDLLIINDTRVLPARLYGNRPTGGKAEVLLLKRLTADMLGEQAADRVADLKQPQIWEAMVRPGKKLRTGARVIFSDTLSCEVLEHREDGLRAVLFDCQGIFEEELEKLGEMPLPPYIHEKLKDKSRYQTVYAEHDGSAAAPTAGLHFTPELMASLKEKGVLIAPVTLSVGLGTFRPVKAEKITDHHMHTESYYVPEETARLIAQTKAAGNRVIAVGTTSVRTLESAAEPDGTVRPGHAETDIFIYPGKELKVIDALITNFHLPKSTLMMLVSALYDREEVLRAYKHAVEERYRFFSFGDAMLII
jgi:S-adenosylmethionine:tRNA ribosyltransferase-isomerase